MASPVRAVDSGAPVKKSVTAGTDLESMPLAKVQKRNAAARQEPSGSLFLNVLAKLACVLALIFACAAVWRKLQGVLPQGGALGGPGIQIVSTTPLGAQRMLHLVAVGRQQLLVGATPQQITLLAALDDGAPGWSPVNGGYAEMSQGSGYAAPGAESVQAERPWEESPVAADRFEELLLRLRRLETEQAARGAEDAADRGGDRYVERPTRALESRGMEAGGQRSRGGAGEGSTASPAPGSLFRTSGTRAGRDA